MVIVMNKKVRAILSLLIVVLIINVFSQKVQASDIIELGSGSDYAINLSVPGNKTAKWSSSNNLVATVTQKGKVTGKQLGYALIMAETSKTIYYWTIHVVPGEEVLTYIGDETKIKHISEKTKTMLIGESNSFKLYLYNIEGSPTWKSSNKNVATVSSNGGVDCVVTGKKEGKATITATVNGKKYSCKVTVYKKTLYAKPTSVTLDVGEAKEITLSLKSNSPTNYKISPSSIVELEWGKLKNTRIPLTIYGLKKGKIIITVHNEETNEKLRIPVTVNQSEDETTIDETVSDNEKKPKDPEYKAFQKEWLTEKSLSNYYDGHITRIYDLYLTITNKDGIQASYDITNCPKTRLEPGVIYEGTCGTSTIRFQFIKELELDGIKYEFNCICLNMEDLRNADIIR